MRIALLSFDIHRLEVIFRVYYDRQIEALRVTPGKPGIPVRAPLHRRPHAVAVSQIDVVAHPDLVTVVKNRGTGEGEKQPFINSILRR
jgi:hypothetical protein